ncbi:S-adenosylmethionine decarboxylase proenzyme [Psilocybe cubensis]|uniref:S-adenosylmethionine decarboxylase proenzyme n=2 Tax=Psilocybe cubensis TaxID=181762 RepID=A0ACB8HBD3_PSICU|nr:S-adenosylmethionine decarboxylase proenzyme [Psilocybe cubensis]KAH9485305.1 S-adenosylmethionine decarboxylase proenzyme [Psilocybe cubensis]
MSPDTIDDYQASAPFEGPEKLLEIWFAPSATKVPILDKARGKKTGLRTVSRQTWEDMLDIVKCKVLSTIEGDEMDAYLLSESSFFVSPHRLILKTCGTTLNLLGLPRILEIAAREANLSTVYRFFYSRKSFMFPERQMGPHRDWKQEVEFLDQIFSNGAAYTIGKVNGDHWLLYLTGAEALSTDLSPSITHHMEFEDRHIDYTIEILMSDLSTKARQPFFFSETSADEPGPSPAALAADLSDKLGITAIFPPSLTHLDAYAFQPCGYSSNALIKWGHESLQDNFEHGARTAGHFGEGYYTIHVTPEEGWSYASFECNVPLSTSKISHQAKIPDLKSLIKRVVNIFEPGRITLTLFISSEDNDTGGESAVEAAQRAFKIALAESPRVSNSGGSKKLYKRTDKINYEFGGYDLAFASFELK